MKPKGWSYSAITSFETCPKKYFAESVAKTVPFEEGEVQRYGKDAHKALELRVLKDKPLPMDLVQHERLMKKITAMEGVTLGEQRMALNRKFEPVGWFDSDVWVRGQADLIKMRPVLRPNVALVIDYKFGKPTPADKPGRYDQLMLMAMLFAQYHKNVKIIETAFYWGKERRLDPYTVHRGFLKEAWNRWFPRVELFEEAFHKEEFPAKQNGLCARWCRVKECPYNGSK